MSQIAYSETVSHARYQEPGGLMFDSLPPDASNFKTWPWSQIQPYYDDLAERDVTPSTVEAWLRDWTRLLELIEESYWRLYVDRNADTTNKAANDAFDAFVGTLQPEVRA